MSRNLQSDLKHLSTLAFRRSAHCAGLLEKFHALKNQITATGQASLFWNLYDWLLVPLSLWPLDFQGLASHLLAHLSTASPTISPTLSPTSSETLSESPSPHSRDSLIHLLRLIGPPPTLDTQSAIAHFERFVESGQYEKMLKQSQKFDEQEQALLHEPQLAADWALLKRLFNVKDFQNSRGVIRRRLSLERNLHEPGWHFDWSDPSRRFHFFFDAFCYRWRLYGMEHDRPLLLKISVNPTPHGTMILIPRHWSLDPRRDLDWPLINRLHRARGAKRQGPKISPARIQKLAEASQVKSLRDRARKLKLKGEQLHDFICRGMKRDPRTDPSWWKRLLK